MSTSPVAPEKDSPRLRVSALGGCALAVLAGLLAFVCVWTLLSLGTRSELVWRLGEPTELRVWLLRATDVAGVGWSHGKVVERGESTVCVQTLVGFWTWRGSAPAPNPPTCDCYRLQERTWVSEGACPP